jgi:hypothetical protein
MNLKETGWEVWNEFEPSDPTKGGEFFNQLNDYYLFKMNSAP